MRRILLVMSVAALMVAMMVATAMPAFAQEPSENFPGQGRQGPEAGLGEDEVPLPFGGQSPEAGFDNACKGLQKTGNPDCI